MLLDVTTVLTDGSLNGVPYRLDSPYRRNGELDMERLFLKTAHEMNVPLPKSDNDLERERLLTDMKQYEQKLLDIQLENVDLDLEETQVKDLIARHEERGLTLEQLSDDGTSAIPYKSMNDISPFEFKKDLMETTNWHLYYKKLSQIRMFTQDRSTWPYFNQVFMVSAKQNRGISAIRVSAITSPPKMSIRTSSDGCRNISSHEQNPRRGCSIETSSPINTLRKSPRCAYERRCSSICPKRSRTAISW